MSYLPAPGSFYPQHYLCMRRTGVSYSDQLQISSWVVQFDETTTSIPVPDFSAVWLAAIVWDQGNARVDGNPIKACWGGGYIGFRPLGAGSKISADPGMRVVIVGLSTPADQPSFDAPVVPGLTVPLNSVDYGQADLLAYLRVIRTTAGSGDIVQESAYRSALVMTSPEGPQPVLVPVGTNGTLTAGDIDFVEAPGASGLSFDEGSNDELSAVILDFYCQTIDNPGGDEGCSWRCWSGGGILEDEND